MLIEKQGQFFKSDGKLIYGWALVCEQKNADGDWERYVDTQGDHIPEDVMVEAALDFAKNSRIGKDMHDGDQVASVPFIYVVTKNSNELGIATDKTGMLIGWEPNDASLLDAVSKGERTGFSIGGYVLESDDGAEKSKRTKKSKGDAAASPRIFRRFRIDEISLVDSPAMEGATIGYVKNADGQARRVIAKRGPASVEKRSALTSAALGHTHLICGLDDSMAGTTSYESLYDENTPRDYYTGHSHPWVRSEDGSITVGEAMGHTHAVGALSASLAKAAPAQLTIPAIEPRSKSTTANAVPTVKSQPETKPMKTIVLTEAQHAHYSKLSGEDAEAFLAKSSTDRDAIVKAAVDADPVVFKGELTGIEVRKSQGDLAKRLAEQNEALTKSVKESAEAASKAKSEKLDEIYKAKAGEILPSFTKSLDARKLIVKSLMSSGADQAQIDEAFESLKGANAALKMLGEMQGVTGDNEPVGGDPLKKFNAKLAEFAKSKNKTPVEATAEFINTDEGDALYAELSAAAK